MKLKTEKSQPKKIAYIVYLWINQNIDYEAAFYFVERSVDIIPEGQFRNYNKIHNLYI